MKTMKYALLLMLLSIVCCACSGAESSNSGGLADGDVEKGDVDSELDLPDAEEKDKSENKEDGDNTEKDFEKGDGDSEESSENISDGDESDVTDRVEDTEDTEDGDSETAETTETTETTEVEVETITTCYPDPCTGHHQTCVMQTLDHGKCVCAPGYGNYGGMCKPQRPCAVGGLCSAEHRECVDNNGNADCGGCAKGYVDKSGTCQRDDNCDQESCAGHGVCTDKGSYVTCECDEGYDGENCGFCKDGYAGYPDCKKMVCEPESLRCNANKGERCDYLGQWVIVKDCTTMADAVCSYGNCVSNMADFKDWVDEETGYHWHFPCGIRNEGEACTKKHSDAVELCKSVGGTLPDLDQLRSLIKDCDKTVAKDDSVCHATVKACEQSSAYKCTHNQLGTHMCGGCGVKPKEGDDEFRECYWPKGFGKCRHGHNSTYWASTQAKGEVGEMFLVIFSSGRIGYDPGETTGRAVMCFMGVAERGSGLL